jgi:hypothetical protein
MRGRGAGEHEDERRAADEPDPLAGDQEHDGAYEFDTADEVLEPVRIAPFDESVRVRRADEGGPRPELGGGAE